MCVFECFNRVVVVVWMVLLLLVSRKVCFEKVVVVCDWDLMLVC